MTALGQFHSSPPIHYSHSDPGKVLVVDDNPPSRKIAAALLAVEGYHVSEANSGLAALNQVTHCPPDIVLLDVSMPEMDGFEVCRQLKQNEDTRLIPVIFVTAMDDRRARLKGIEAGGDDFLTKPFDQLQLSARVRSLVHQKRLNEDLDHASEALFSIARTVESRDPHTGDHCERLSLVAQAFGEYLHLTAAQVRDLVWASYLHDIGKVGIPDAVLLKTGPLSAAEQDIMRQHVFYGEEICRPLRTMSGVLPIIRHHHERWDGSGYPDQLVGNDIPFLVQVFQIIDIYDALTNERPYKSAFSQKKALDIMWDEVRQGWRNPELMAQFEAFVKIAYTHFPTGISA